MLLLLAIFCYTLRTELQGKWPAVVIAAFTKSCCYRCYWRFAAGAACHANTAELVLAGPGELRQHNST
jgi:hypothetical protein